MLTLLVAAFLLGLVFNATPGPVFAETIHRHIKGGFRAALAVQVGSLVGDASWALLGLAGVGLLLQLEVLQVPINLLGAAYLTWLAWDAWRAAGAGTIVSADGGRIHASEAMRSGVLLSLTNPQNVAYWAAVGSALGSVGVQEPRPADYGIFYAGFLMSSIAWAIFFAALVDRLFRRVGASWVRATYRACAAAFLLLALLSVRDLARRAGLGTILDF